MTAAQWAIWIGLAIGIYVVGKVWVDALRG